MTTNARLIIHTTCGIEFEVVEDETDRVLITRTYWCDEGDEESEEEGVERFIKIIEKKGWNYIGQSWS